ncbi:serine threonine- kinase endoribonuclease IRE1-like [Paramuricea clavata]|uniref:Serine threonine- kinase endoribonuclease IRE1-like n=1 Tax=Paramuricea clavata TaxID=317549 RepID=A0A6S7KBP2_PARCT|nr:serine threonine- kinase endoribonuclease IRE1-like [Paramuricea clavata]
MSDSLNPYELRRQIQSPANIFAPLGQRVCRAYSGWNRGPIEWNKVSVKHREKFERLLELWESNPESITIINGDAVCFKNEFAIGSGSYGTEVYICLGFDGIERAIKRLPKQMCEKFLKNERDILNSRNAVESPRIVNYFFYDDTSNPDFGYLILNLYEQNLEEFIKEKGERMTESDDRNMIRQVLEGLKALHAREPRILHRDLKPTNILVDVYGNLLLSDFGIGRFFPEQELKGNLLACRSLSPWHASLPTSEGIKQFSADLVGK